MSNETLTRAYELTSTLVAALDAGDYRLAADLADERSPLLMSLAPEQSDAGLAMIRDIMAMNATITDKAAAARNAISSRYNDAQRRVSAVGQYLATEQLR